MRNVWKGLIVGGLVGVVAGVLLDALGNGSRKAAQLGRYAKEQAPAAADWVASTAGKGADRLSDASIPEKVRDTAQKIAGSDVADQAREIVTQVVAKGKEAAGNGK